MRKTLVAGILGLIATVAVSFVELETAFAEFNSFGGQVPPIQLNNGGHGADPSISEFGGQPPSSQGDRISEYQPGDDTDPCVIAARELCRVYKNPYDSEEWMPGVNELTPDDPSILVDFLYNYLLLNCQHLPLVWGNPGQLCQSFETVWGAKTGR